MLVQKGIRVIPYCLYEPKKKREPINNKARRARDHLISSIIHMPLCMSMCLCNLISSPIDIQYLVVNVLANSLLFPLFLTPLTTS